MKFGSLVLLSVLYLTNDSSAFSIPSATMSGMRPLSRSELNSETDKSMSASEAILAKARAAVGMPTEPEAPKMEFPFEESLMSDFEVILKILEKRVTNGPGSLTREEVSQFEDISTRLIIEMDEVNELRGVQSVGRTTATTTPSASTPAPPSPPVLQRETNPIRDISNDDEGPAFDGKGGFGLARGTTNTYIIPGMDEMSPEEYRAALQQTVIDRQKRRYDGKGGVVGNRAAHDYLSNLGYGGTSKSLSRGRDADKDE